MSATRGPWRSALAWMILGVTLTPAAALAQSMEVLFEPFGVVREPAPRSPRLLGLGRMTLTSDRNNQLRPWDFGRNPTGLRLEDSTSIIDVHPTTASNAASHQGTPSGANLNRQILGARASGVGYEMWRRPEGRNAYGFYGDLASDEVRTPYDGVTGRRHFAASPTGLGVLNGTVPLVRSGRLSYALRGGYLKQSAGDEYRRITGNPTGEYLDQGGDLVPPPDFFQPDDITVTITSLGAHFAYEFGPWLTAAIGGDGLQTKIRGENVDLRHESGRSGTRPYGIGQVTLHGRLGPSLEWITDGHLWQAANEERWFFTIAGRLLQEPLAGRGTLLQRFEEGTRLRTRARWTSGPLELNGEFGTYYQKVRITPPAIGDRTSFNYFRNTIPQRVNADSLVIPDSVRRDQSEIRDYTMAVGGAWRVWQERALLAAEFQVLRQRLDQLTSGGGPERKRWELRGGLEVRCTPVLTTRLGYGLASDDLDDLTERNEFVRQALTAGFGLQPANARWDVGAAFVHEWSRPDFDAPGDLRETGQQLALQIRWVL